ncbi:MAG: hypothetical protein U5L02_06365 [Rheinheimera sp.]|nr:hypothetical protein [Rheinheimera sp.]
MSTQSKILSSDTNDAVSWAGLFVALEMKDIPAISHLRFHAVTADNLKYVAEQADAMAKPNGYFLFSIVQAKFLFKRIDS